MAGFWESELGAISGKQEDAFAGGSRGSIPDGTHDIARIKQFDIKQYGDSEYLQVSWQIVEGKYRNRIVFHKLNVYDQDAKKRHRSLNMLKLLHDLYVIPIQNDAPPSQSELNRFLGKLAGIVINEILGNDGKVRNYVSEVHPSMGFHFIDGIPIEATPRNHLPKENDFEKEEMPF